METTSSPTTSSHSYLSTPGDGVEGLGICCEAAEGYVPYDTTIDVAYDDALWQAQIDNHILQFQQSYEQKLYQSAQNEAPPVMVEAPYAYVPAHSIAPEDDGNQVEQQKYDALCAAIDTIQAPYSMGCGPCPPPQQGLQPFPSFAITADHTTWPTHCAQTAQTNQQITLTSHTTLFPSQMSSIIYQDTPSQLPSMSSTPYLQPSADIHDAYSRRLSVSSNAPSSVFSSDYQGTPYFITPSTTPHFAFSVPPDIPCTPRSTLSSPLPPSHSRSLSSSSLKTTTSTHRPVRPAPYTHDAAQRQRWSTGKTMSLPSRRTQPPDSPPSPGRMRAMAEQNNNGMCFDDSFANGDRASFNQNLEIIRQGLPCIAPGAGHDDEQNPIGRAEEQSASSQRPVLAAIQPKILAPASTLSQARMPPLNLPELSSRPISPPPEDLSPPNSAAPTQNPVSPYDAYTPKYKRGTKGQLEGYCGLCKPGRWLNMKNSKYWYDKNYNHGINSKTRRAFDVPIDRRYKIGHSVIRQGLCGVCNRWIDMDTCKMTWKHWWKHAYKCHNKLDDFNYEVEKNNSLRAPCADQQQDAVARNDVASQHLQQINHEQQPWLFPTEHLMYGSNFVLPS